MLVFHRQYYSNVSTENADSVKITEDEMFVSGDEVRYEVTHSINRYNCDMISLEGEANGDSSISFADDEINLGGYDGGYIYMTVYVDGEGFVTIPVDIKAIQEGIKIEDIMKDPCQYGHMLSLKETVPATFDADGNTEYWHCKICGKAYVFYDWQKETEISLEDTVIKRIKTVSLKKTTFTYNKSVQRPALIIKDSDGKTIASKILYGSFLE